MARLRKKNCIQTSLVAARFSLAQNLSRLRECARSRSWKAPAIDFSVDSRAQADEVGGHLSTGKADIEPLYRSSLERHLFCEHDGLTAAVDQVCDESALVPALRVDACVASEGDHAHLTGCEVQGHGGALGHDALARGVQCLPIERLFAGHLDEQ